MFYASASDSMALQHNNDYTQYSITSISNSSPISEYPEHPTCPSDSEWIETEYEDEGTVHFCVIRPEAPVWLIQNGYTIQNNQVYSIFHPEFTPPPPRQVV